MRLPNTPIYKISFDTSSILRIIATNNVPERACNENLHSVLAKFHFNFNVLNPRDIGFYHMSNAKARKLVASEYVKRVGDLSDVLIIADTVPHGRAVLQFLPDPDASLAATRYPCHSPLHLVRSHASSKNKTYQITNVHTSNPRGNDHQPLRLESSAETISSTRWMKKRLILLSPSP
ncbi:hypothetical protein BC830DRAFT_1134406 [Chytriomyces sp. MP71]|nr:hypothetical protein BC830DRAFT_1134406 [Chytriomyces sp. MP71]